MLSPVQRLADIGEDRYLDPFRDEIRRWNQTGNATRRRLLGEAGQTLADFSSGHTWYGVHRTAEGRWQIREWLPNAIDVVLLGDMNDWREEDRFRFQRLGDHGDWELDLPSEALAHAQEYRLLVRWPGGEGERLGAWCRRTVQDEATKAFNAQIWMPDEPYAFQHQRPAPRETGLLVYEAHVGMALEEARVGTWDEFIQLVLPRIVAGGYTCIQLMAVQEHPYYGSFGYHVSSFFAPSSRYGTPDDLKRLVDACHSHGLQVVMDLVHSHAVKNELEGIARLDGTRGQFFHEGERGEHSAWDSLCFDYGKTEVMHFLLSNCRYWMDEFQFDGFRFDGVTSMLYYDHGLGEAFTDYQKYFGGGVDPDAFVYLQCANEVIHTVHPHAITIAEDMSGLPGLAAKVHQGGAGFDYRLAMGVPDFWFKMLDQPDEAWNMDALYYELTNRRADERAISYVECHDQAIVGGKTLIFTLMDQAMYWDMSKEVQSLDADRGTALHKVIRLITCTLAGHGYLTFIGNEFGHPEWVDFPREGNDWSFDKARRLWSLADDPQLRFAALADFEAELLKVMQVHDLFAFWPRHLYVHNDDKILAWARGDLVVVVNLHASESRVDYHLPVPAGRYELILDSDAGRFDGHARLDQYQTVDVEEQGTRFYLPNRSAQIWRWGPPGLG